MISIYLSGRALLAARSVDPMVSAAAVHNAVEVAVAEELLQVAGWPREAILARAETLLRGGPPSDATERPPAGRA